VEKGGEKYARWEKEEQEGRGQGGKTYLVEIFLGVKTGGFDHIKKIRTKNLHRMLRAEFPDKGVADKRQGGTGSQMSATGGEAGK